MNGLDAVPAQLVARRAIRHAVLAVESGDGALRWAGAAGEASPGGPPMQTGTAFHLASVTKLYTAVAVLQLEERGRIDLDAPMADYLPPELVEGLHVRDGMDASGAITVRNLLSHTSGLPDYFLGTPEGGTSFGDRVVEGDFGYSIADVVARVRELRPSFPPQGPAAGRQRARYSDTNFQLLGAILEAVTGWAFHEVLERQILVPLGLDATWVAGHPRGETPSPPAAMWAGDQALDVPRAMASMAPEGGLIGTVADAVAFLRALLAGAVFERPETLGSMRARWNRFGLPRDRSAIMNPSWPIEYGLGIKRFRPPRVLTAGRVAPTFVGHSGSTGSWLFHCPDHDLYLAGTVDQTTAAAVPYRLLPRLVRTVSSRSAGRPAAGSPPG